MKSMTYGILPTESEFRAAYDAQDTAGELRGGLFHFGNDKRVGTCAMTCSELWNEVQKAFGEYEVDQKWEENGPGDWVSAVLYCLGFEWI
ncbi:MAG: hypothetical protein PHO67_08960 [Candidatus Omnitrophica bacterium]|nr:hypothetical protein [Candidatus Omnitrophota bacterium]